MLMFQKIEQSWRATILNNSHCIILQFIDETIGTAFGDSAGEAACKIMDRR